MKKRIPIVAIVGRTNVGKSTLLNAIAGRRVAIVKDTPGVTRDRSYANITRYEFPFIMIDTGGLFGEEDCNYTDLVKAQAELAIAEADIVLALFDGKNGLHPQDQEVVALLRSSKKPVLWIVNKCEKPETEANAVEFFCLGISEYHCISAAHNQGIKQLLAKLRDLLAAPTEEASKAEDKEEIRIAVLGRPNAGKSTLVNKLIGTDRLITSPEAGTTRDSVDVPLVRDGKNYVLVDTAGLRKKAQIKDGTVERYSNLRALRALAQCDVALLLLDASKGRPSEQDTKIAGLIHDRGTPLIFVVNKWDAVEKDHKTAKKFTEEIRDVFKFARYAPVIFISALSGKRCPGIFQKVEDVYKAANERIQTSELNRIIERAFTRKAPPVYRGQPIKFYFATQIAVMPPTIVIFANHPKRLPVSYQRFLINCIRKEYPYEGSNIKLIFRKKSEEKR